MMATTVMPSAVATGAFATAHFRSFNLAVIVAIHQREAFSGAVLKFGFGYPAVAIKIHPLQHTLCATLNAAFLDTGNHFVDRELSIAVGVSAIKAVFRSGQQLFKRNFTITVGVHALKAFATPVTSIRGRHKTGARGYQSGCSDSG